MPKARNMAEMVNIMKVAATPRIRKDGRQETIVSINNGGQAFVSWVKVTVKNEMPYIVESGNIKTGVCEITVPVTDTNGMLKPGEKTHLKLELFDNSACNGEAKAVYTTGSWERTRHWEFYLSQQMHTDLGYTMYQEDLKPIFSEYLDTVKDYMKNSDNRAEDLQKYKYLVESSYMLGEAYMKKRNADQISELLELVKSGRMSIGAGQFNFTLENMGTEEIARAAYYTNRFLVDKLGIQSNTTQQMFDNPAFSKSYVDIAVEAGIKYGIHSMNGDRSPYHEKKLNDLFYMEGMNPENKLLIFNAKHYAENFGFGGGGIHADAPGSVSLAEPSLLELISFLESRTGRNAYPYDKLPLPLIPCGDNQPPMEEQIIIANQLNKKWNDAGYAYPKITVAFPDRFFEEVEAEYGHMIPVESGTEENWWNDGWGTTAYESGINKQVGNMIPVAETVSSFASMLTGKTYPYEDLYEAVERNLIYDEHTWGYNSYDGSLQYQKQFEWKRSNAFGAKALADKVLDGSLRSMASAVPVTDKGIYVYNPLNWVRNDVVTITDRSGLPENFEIKDGEQSVPYIVADGVLTFVAERVPALGYKTFTVNPTDTTPSFNPQVTATENSIENRYYKVIFAANGTISSIIDKQNGNREIVDADAPAAFNQYQYYDDHGIPFSNMGASFSEDKWTLYTPNTNAGTLTVTSNSMGATAVLDTSTFRTGSIVQKVTLYNNIPRIDIINQVVKKSLPKLQSKEEAFYTFPFKVDGDYEIRYDLPIGNAVEGEQVYGTSTDWYTIGKWINVKDAGSEYNMTLAVPNTNLVQLGERRTGNWSFDYKSKKPYIYSYVMNNMWQTNFQGDQPGCVGFRYSIATNESAGVENTAKFGWEVSMPLQATVISCSQNGSMSASGSLLKVSKDNVLLTTMKVSEANSDGMILRFHEVAGKAVSVQVTLPVSISSVVETDIIENDKAEQKVTDRETFAFDISAYGIKTFRIRFGTAPATVNGVAAVSTSKYDETYSSTKAKGTKLSWNTVSGALYYEVFRSTNQNFVPGSGNYLASTSSPEWFDTQVSGEMNQPYYYKIRAVSVGVKGKPSITVTPSVGISSDIAPPNAPILAAQVRKNTRIDLYWTPVTNNTAMDHYVIYRDGTEIGKTGDSYLCTYRDELVQSGKKYAYMVKAVDCFGNTSESNTATVETYSLK